MQNWLNRRQLLALGAAWPLGAWADEPPVPITGKDQPALRPFDDLLTKFVREQGVPGASLAVTRQGKLVYARGVGFADRDRKEPVEPTALFRIASVSKPLTAVAVMQLVERGKFKLDDRVVDLMKVEPFAPNDRKPDPRWRTITVLHCLQHTGGWDRDRSGDPIGRAWTIAETLNIKPPVLPIHIVRYMMGQPLDFDPGERYAYSNLGYLILGRIIEEKSGLTYEKYIQQEVFGPLKSKKAQLGKALLEQRVPDEVKYYDHQQAKGRCLYPPKLGEQVPSQYGADNLEGYEAHGGWIASAPQLVKFASAFDDPKRCPLLKEASIQEMWASPPKSAPKKKEGTNRESYYSCGWLVVTIDERRKNTFHSGYIRGTEALLVRRWDGLNWAILFNVNNSTTGTSLVKLIDRPLHEAANQVKAWPETDLFAKHLT